MIYKSKQKEVDAHFYNGRNGEELAKNLYGLTWMGGTINQLMCHRNESQFTVQHGVFIFEDDGVLKFMTPEYFEKEYEAQ